MADDDIELEDAIRQAEPLSGWLPRLGGALENAKLRLAKLNEAGTVWYAVLEGGDTTTVDAALLKAGSDASFLLSGSASAGADEATKFSATTLDAFAQAFELHDMNMRRMQGNDRTRVERPRWLNTQL